MAFSKSIKSNLGDSTALFYSTYDFGTNSSDDLVLGSSEQETHDFRQTNSTRGLDFEPTIEESEPELGREMPGSRLWANTASMFRINGNGISKGWKAHQSGPSEAYRPDLSPSQSLYDSEEEEEEEYSDHESPPSFLSPIPFAELAPPPLIPPSTLYIYPSTTRNGSGGELKKFRNSGWIVIYCISFLSVLLIGINQWLFLPSTDRPHIPTILPALPLLALLSLLSLIASLASLVYLLVVKNSIRHLIFIALIGGPVGLSLIGLMAGVGSFGQIDSRVRLGVRLFGFGCFLGATWLGWIGIKRRDKVGRTVLVLELASDILLSHPPLFLLCLALSILSTILALPFLMILAQLVSTGTLTHPNPSKWILIHSGWASWETFFTMLVWVWSLGILRGIQKVTVAGVVGNWYFNRHEPVRPSILEITSSSFSRAIGPSIGTIIAASFLLSLFETIAILARKMRNVVRSSQLPGFLHPISIIAPLLGFIASTLEIFNGWVLTWAGLTGDDLISSAKKARELVRMNGTLGLIDNLLTKLILNVISITLALFSGLIGFLVVSPRIGEPEFAPLVATLCFAIPFWTIRLCADVLGDACDTLFLAWNVDVNTGVTHCKKASEAFGEPDEEDLSSV